MTKKSTTRSPNLGDRRDGSALALGQTAMPEPKRAKNLAKNLAKNPAKNRAKADPKQPVQPDAALAIRRLRRQLAEAQAKIEQLQACADTDFLLGVLNRRGFERELGRAVAYIRRYRAAGALIVLD